jgi:hypothetical protein
MPFTSKAQMKKCFAMKGRGQAKGWNCEEWAHKTPSLKKLPEHVDGGEKKGAAQRAVISELEKQAGSISQLLGVRAGAMMLGLDRT